MKNVYLFKNYDNVEFLYPVFPRKCLSLFLMHQVEPIKETSAVVSPSHIPSEDSPANPKVLDSNSAPVSQKPSGSENSKGAVVVDSNQLNETKQVAVEGECNLIN